MDIFYLFCRTLWNSKAIYKGVEEFGKHMKTEENYIKEVQFIDMDDNMCQTIHKTFEKYLGQGKPI